MLWEQLGAKRRFDSVVCFDMILSKLEVGVLATVVSIGNKRFESLGIRVGKTIQLLRRSHNCLHFRVGMAEFAIRQSDADIIKVGMCSHRALTDAKIS